MKKFLFFGFMVIVNSIFAQNPIGKLYTLAIDYNPKMALGYITPQNMQFHLIDSVIANDFCKDNNKLYCAGKDIRIYNITTGQLTDSISDVYAKYISEKDQFLIVATDSMPYFRVYNKTTKQPVFNLNSSKVSKPCNDMHVSGDTVYLAYDDSLCLISLTQQDTLRLLQTFWPFGWAGFNSYIVEANNEIYIDIEYITGAIRFSMIKMNKQTLQFDTVFHSEGNGNFYKPIVANDIIYMLTFPSNYNPFTDSLTVVFPAYFQHQSAVAYDKTSSTFFVFNALSQNIKFNKNNIYSNDSVFPGGTLIKAIWDDQSGASVEEIPDKAEITIFPNPFTDCVSVKSLNSDIFDFQLFSIDGKLIHQLKITHKTTISTGDLPSGIYFYKVIGNQTIKSGKLVKN